MYHLRGSAEDAADRHTQGAQGHHLSERFFFMGQWGNQKRPSPGFFQGM